MASKSTKECKTCNQQKYLANFPKRKYKAHIGYRNECKLCIASFQKKYRQENKEKIADQKKQWTENNRNKKRKTNYQWFIENKEKSRQSVKNHRINNMEYYRFKRAKRRAYKLQATFPGFDEELKQIYKNCPPGYHVDHIVPLKNPKICGLHVPWNLQYLPAQENLKKGNRFDESWMV